MFSILKRRSTWYFVITTVVYVTLLMFFNTDAKANNMLIMGVVSLTTVMSVLFTMVYLFALLWCLGAKWKEDKDIKRNHK